MILVVLHNSLDKITRIARGFVTEYENSRTAFEI